MTSIAIGTAVRGGPAFAGAALFSGLLFFGAGPGAAAFADEFSAAMTCVPSADTPAGEPLRCDAQIGPGAPGVLIELRWQDDDGMRVIDRISVTRKGESAPLQVIEGIESRAFPEWEMNGFELLDLNFDGFLDMRLVEFLPAGPHAPYLHWLWSAEKGEFVSAPRLDEIGYVEPDDEEGLLYAPWRNGAMELGEDTYVYENGRLRLTGREADRFSEDGSCTRLSYRPSGGSLQLASTRPCAE